jgi:NADH-quinone oxidoreductase subunit F
MVCAGTGCQASQSPAVIEALRREISTQKLDSKVCLRATGCHGFCEQAPTVIIEPGNIFYCHVAPDDAFEIVYQTVVKGELIERLLYTDPVSGEKARTESDIPFYRLQDQQLLSLNRLVDPCSIDAAAVDSRQGASGLSVGRQLAMRSMLSAMLMKAIPEPSWTGAYLRVTLIWCWRV